MDKCEECFNTGFIELDIADADIVAQYRATGDMQIMDDWIDENLPPSNRGCSCHINPPCSWCTEYNHHVKRCSCAIGRGMEPNCYVPQGFVSAYNDW